MAYLSMEAVPTFLKMVHTDYGRDQQALAIKAKQSGDMDQAIIHYSNLVFDSASPGINNFQDAKRYWTLFFPIAAPMLKRILSEPGVKDQATRINEAMYRGMLADALDKAGRLSEARQEYIRASQLFGYGDDVERAKKLIQVPLSNEAELLKALQR